jgi:hypothetical protein
MAALMISKGSDVIKAAVSVAPVTNWKYYDNIYTERFLRKPQDNKGGYEDNSPTNFVKNIKGKGQLSINDIHVELENKIILCGNYSDSVGFDPGSNIKNHYTSNQSNGFLCFWTDSGTFLQSYSINSNRNNFAQTIHSDNEENIYLSGFTLGKFWVNTIYQTDTFIPKQNSDIYLLKFDWYKFRLYESP